MSMIGKAVAARNFTKDELKKVEDRLVELGYNDCDRVVHIYDDSFRIGDYYGVDSDGDTVFVSNVFSLCEHPDIVTRDEYLELIGLTLKTGEPKVDLRGKCVRVDKFTLNELEKVQERLVELGVHVCEEVSIGLVEAYEDGYYGVDGVNDTMFYSDMDCYSLTDEGVEAEELTAGEFLQLIGLVDMSEKPLAGNAEPSGDKLYKVVANNGNTYYFGSREHLIEVIKSDDKESSRLNLAVLIINKDGEILKSRWPVQHLVETEFDIEEL